MTGRKPKGPPRAGEGGGRGARKFSPQSSRQAQPEGSFGGGPGIVATTPATKRLPGRGPNPPKGNAGGPVKSMAGAQKDPGSIPGKSHFLDEQGRECDKRGSREKVSPAGGHPHCPRRPCSRSLLSREGGGPSLKRRSTSDRGSGSLLKQPLFTEGATTTKSPPPTPASDSGRGRRTPEAHWTRGRGNGWRL